MNWSTKKEIWRYVNPELVFCVEVHKWEERGKFHWNKYLLLYPKNKDFGKYRDERTVFPVVPYQFNYGVTYYREDFNKSGDLIMQTYGDDYSHVWDMDDPVDELGTRVFADAEMLISQMKELLI